MKIFNGKFEVQQMHTKKSLLNVCEEKLQEILNQKQHGQLDVFKTKTTDEVILRYTNKKFFKIRS